MNGDSSTAPTRPPPGPSMPGLAVFGCEADLPRVSPQHAVLSVPSSKVMKIRPFLYAGECMISGIQICRNALTWVSPPGSPLAHGASWPSLHRLGDSQEKSGVVLALDRSLSSGWNDSTCASQ